MFLQKRTRLAIVPVEQEEQEEDAVDGEDSESDSDDDGEYAVAPNKELAALQAEIRVAVTEDGRQERELAATRRTMRGPSNGPVSEIVGCLFGSTNLEGLCLIGCEWYHQVCSRRPGCLLV